MLRINNLNKYFHKGKSNEIHVINDTTLEFENTGLVCILGESGSGKTTLINTISGIDTFQKGSITVEDTTINRYSLSKIEKLRNSKYGYIFQEQYLLQDHTVTYNVRLALNMYQLSEEEKDARVEYVLDAVGMKKYRKRLVSELSGGQQQRVAIARALVKTPDVIFADEPTGNLDEENTMRTMSIIKKVSKECLVILVTHEKKIAEFFADRIIYIQDGKVIRDEQHDCIETYQYSDSTNIYLKEFDKMSSDNGGVDLHIYNNPEQKKITLNVVYLGDKIYLQTPDQANVVYLSSDTERQMIDDVKPVLDMEQVEEFDYSLPRLEAGHKSRLNFKEIYDLAKGNIKSLGKKQAFMMISFLFTAILLVVATIDYMTSTTIDKESFVTEDSHYINIFAKQNSPNQMDKFLQGFGEICSKLESNKIVKNRYIDLHKDLYFKCDGMEQIQDIQYNMTNFAYVTLDHFNKENLIYGRMPKKRNEIVVDKWLIDTFYKSDSMLKFIMPKTTDFLKLKLKWDQTDAYLTIVGICDTGEPTVYLDKYMGISLSVRDKTVASLQQLQAAYPGKYDKIKLGPDEVLVSDSVYNGDSEGYGDVYEDADTNATMYKAPNDMSYKVVGTFPDKFMADSVIDDKYYNLYLDIMIYKFKTLNIYSDEQGKQEVRNYFANNQGNFDPTYVQLKVTDTYQDEMRDFEAKRAYYMNARFVVTVTIFAISMLMLFFTMKSNAIRRMQEISVYRLMGIARTSLLLAFVLEVLIMTSCTVLPVVLILSGMVKFITSIHTLGVHLVYTWSAAGLIVLFLYAVNILVSIVSVYRYINMPLAQMKVKN